LPAQNDLLKNLEEPPADTLFLLTTSDPTRLLPTVKSRTLQIRINRPSELELKDYLTSLGTNEADINRAISISGGIPGIAINIATNQDDSLLSEAANMAKTILNSNQLTRLTIVNDLCKNDRLFDTILDILQQMGTIALKTASSTQTKKWQKVIDLAYRTKLNLSVKSNLKLTITSFMLDL
jgi:DNA polymerase III gamma/tau subunit